LQYLGGQQTFMLAAIFPLIGLIVIGAGLKLSHHGHHSKALFK